MPLSADELAYRILEEAVQDGALRECGVDVGMVVDADEVTFRVPYSYFDEPARDMKPGLLKGSEKLRHNKKGEAYKIIPFQHEMDNLSTRAKAALATRKRYEDEVNMTRRSRAWMLFDNNPEMMLGYLPEYGDTYLSADAPGWTTGIESGIKRNRGRYRNRGDAVTFRTVSDRSPAASWWYPPTRSYNMSEYNSFIQFLLD